MDPMFLAKADNAALQLELARMEWESAVLNISAGEAKKERPKKVKNTSPIQS